MKRNLLIALGACCIGALNAHGALADDFTLENVQFKILTTNYRFPTLEFHNSKLSRADTEQLLSATNTTPLSERLKQLNVEKIVAPLAQHEAVTPNMTMKGESQKIVLQKIVSGKAAVIDTESSVLKTTNMTNGQQGSGDMTMGPNHMEGVDLAAIVHVMNEARVNPDEPKQVLIESITASKTENVMSVPNVMTAVMKIESGRSKKVFGRAYSTPLANVFTEMQTLNPNSNPTMMFAQVITLYTALLSSIDLEDFEVKNITLDANLLPKTPSDSNVAMNVKIDRMTAQNLVNGKLNDAALDKLALTYKALPKADAGSVAAAQETSLNFSMDHSSFNFDASSYFDQSAAKNAAPSLLASLRLTGIAGDSADKSGPLFSFTLGKYQTDLKSFTVDAPGFMNHDFEHLAIVWKADELKTMPKISDQAFSVHQTYDLKNKKFQQDIAMSDPNQGGFQSHIGVDNLSTDILSSDKSTQYAALGLSQPSSLTLSFQDAGILNYITHLAATNDKISDEQERANMAQSVQAALSLIALPADKGKDLLTAVNAFMKGEAKSLTISATPAKPASLMDLGLAAKLSSLLSAVNVTAVAK